MDADVEVYGSAPALGLASGIDRQRWFRRLLGIVAGSRKPFRGNLLAAVSPQPYNQQ
jgi:hypothetical protein